MKVVDEKGKLFGKLNIIDLLVIVLLLVAVVLVVFKVLAKDGAVGAQHTVLTYTVEVKGVDHQGLCPRRERHRRPAHGQWLHGGRLGDKRNGRAP